MPAAQLVISIADAEIDCIHSLTEASIFVYISYFKTIIAQLEQVFNSAILAWARILVSDILVE